MKDQAKEIGDTQRAYAMCQEAWGIADNIFWVLRDNPQFPGLESHYQTLEELSAKCSELAELTASFLTRTHLQVLCRDAMDALSASTMLTIVLPYPKGSAPKGELVRLLTVLHYGAWVNGMTRQRLHTYGYDRRAEYYSQLFRQVISAGIGVHVDPENVDYTKVSRIRHGFKVPQPNCLADPIDLAAIDRADLPPAPPDFWAADKAVAARTLGKVRSHD